MSEFKIGKNEFQYTRMRVFDSLGLYPMLGELLAPMTGGTASVDERVSSFVRSLKTLPQLAEAFEKQSKVKTGDVGGFMPLKPFRESVFQNPLDLIDWVSQCLVAEFGDFLDEPGQLRLQEILARTFSSPSGSPGPSGG